jgi:hypothetical protein
MQGGSGKKATDRMKAPYDRLTEKASTDLEEIDTTDLEANRRKVEGRSGASGSS